MCRSSVRLLAPQQRPCGGMLSAAPGRSQKPPQMDFCPASSFAAADRWARETLCRRDTSKPRLETDYRLFQWRNLFWHSDGHRYLTLTAITVTCLTSPTKVLSEFRFYFSSSNSCVLSASVSIACSLTDCFHWQFNNNSIYEPFFCSSTLTGVIRGNFQQFCVEIATV